MQVQLYVPYFRERLESRGLYLWRKI